MKISPAILLFFLSPAIAELLSGSAPPSEFFNPLIFILLCSLYGSGALLSRELKIRWNKSYVSLFILGAAFGMIEEALMVKSFFDPAWMDIGVLGVYGRWQGINWVWAEWLTIYHSIFSIAIPVTLVELAYPKKRNLSWVNNKMFVTLAVLLTGVTTFGYIFLTDYYPPLLQYCLFVATVAILLVVAWKIPADIGKGTMRILTSKKALVVGFFTGMTLFLFFGVGPKIVNNPLLLLFAGLGIICLLFCFLKRYDWNKDTLYQKFSLVAGALIFLVILTPFQEFDTTRIDNPHGMLLIGLVTTILLLLFNKKLKSNT